VFSAILPQANSLFQIQPKSSDNVYCTENNGNFKLLLQQFRENFDSLWEGILKMKPSSYSVKRNRMKPLEGEDQKSTYNRMFAEMTDVLITNFSYWFRDAPKLLFVPLDHKRFTNYQHDFPTEALNCLMETLAWCFN